MPIFESLAIFFNITVKGLTASIDLLTVFLDGFIITDSKWRYRKLLSNRPLIEELHNSAREYV
jgi:hypothetical protein